MLLKDFNRLNNLKEKQKEILLLVSNLDEKKIGLKVDPELSPISWHLLHCIFIEVLWIRSKYLQDNYYKNKLEKIADPSLVSLDNRDKNLPKSGELILFAKKIFKENILLIKKIASEKKERASYKLSYLVDFLNQHHAQHLETLKIIKNILNIKYNKNYHGAVSEIAPKIYKFKGIEIKEGKYKIGANLNNFSYDNEQPINTIFLKNYFISKNLITISEWVAFVKESGYNRKELWTSKGWNWKTKNNVTNPMNWRVAGKNKFSISTPEGFIHPKKDMAVSNISKYELDAFAKWNKMRIPHEYEWEASFKKIEKKFKVWEWSSNKFFAYNGFKAFPYKEYSYPWFKSNYFTLKGGSIYSLKEIKRYSFRNFYKPHTRYLFSGGRLCL